MHNSILAMAFIWFSVGTLSEQLVAQGAVRVVIDTVASLDEDQAVTVDGGRLAVPYRLPLSQGELVRIDMRAVDTLDPYVILEAPSGERFRDDDGGDGFDAALVLVAEQTGIWTLFASSYYEGEEGDFRLYVTVREAIEPTQDALSPREVSPEAALLQEITAIRERLTNFVNVQAPQRSDDNVDREEDKPEQREALDSLHVDYLRQAQNYMTRVEVGVRGIEAALSNLRLGLQMGSLASPYISTEFREDVSLLDKVRRFLPAVGFIGLRLGRESDDGLWGLAAGSVVSAAIGLFSTSDVADVDEVVAGAMGHFDRTIRLFSFNRMVYNDLIRLDYLIGETLENDSTLATEVQHFNSSHPITANFQEMLDFGDYLSSAMAFTDRFEAKANAGSDIMRQFEASLDVFSEAAEAREARSVWESRFEANTGDRREQQYVLFAETISTSLEEARNRLELAREAWELFEETIYIAPSLRREMEGFMAIRGVIPLI